MQISDGKNAAGGEVAGRPDRTIWAAYVLGYDIWSLWSIQESIWSNRLAVLEGRIPIPSSVQNDAGDLREAITVIVDGGYCEAGLAMRLAGSLERWVRQFDQMLLELRPTYTEPTVLDWEALMPGGCAWIEFSAATDLALKLHPLLASWHSLGEWFWERRLFSGLASSEKNNLISRLRALNDHGEFPFIVDIVSALQPANPRDARSQTISDLWDEVLDRPTLGLIERYLRTCLIAGTRLKPWLKIDGDQVEFLGRTVHPSPSGLRILRVLAQTPRRPVPAVQLITAAHLNCQPDDVAPLISRLREALSPAVNAGFLDPSTRPEEAELGFIAGTRDGTKSYQLEIDRPRVLIAK